MCCITVFAIWQLQIFLFSLAIYCASQVWVLSCCNVRKFRLAKQSQDGSCIKTTLAAQLCFQNCNLSGLCRGKQRYWHLWFCSYKCNYTWIFDSQRLHSWFMSVCCQQSREESRPRDCSSSFLAVVHKSVSNQLCFVTTVLSYKHRGV